MPYTVYKIMHLLGILMLFLAFGGVLNHAINGGTLVAKLGITWPWPGWVLVKLGIWLLFAAVVGLAARSAVLGKGLWWLLLLLGVLAAYMAGVKPF